MHDAQDKHTEAMIARAVDQGVTQALARLGLENGHAREDIRDLRAALDSLRLVRQAALQTVVRVITTGLVLALLAGIALKLKLFGGDG
ncbi:hypothetical protein CCR85_08220 [Rhodothalassium salexigens]|uniref:DUF6127 family protein n=1 Tax=Rhodothalassium salexigens TaxID=1086 RepID=UPI0019149722|nr:DUF6127 family protein [Rhodothalassium salexigens]MBK5911474.1 hypothetical protein [Rhodothalassium salexigens]